MTINKHTKSLTPETTIILKLIQRGIICIHKCRYRLFVVYMWTDYSWLPFCRYNKKV